LNGKILESKAQQRAVIQVAIQCTRSHKYLNCSAEIRTKCRFEFNHKTYTRGVAACRNFSIKSKITAKAFDCAIMSQKTLAQINALKIYILFQNHFHILIFTIFSAIFI
jgi:hypothetical protein